MDSDAGAGRGGVAARRAQSNTLPRIGKSATRPRAAGSKWNGRHYAVRVRPAVAARWSAPSF